MEGKTDNELIAEFLGLERSDGVWDKGQHAYTMKFPDVFNKWVIPSDMKFETSWDWIMPVVEKMDWGFWTIRPGFVSFESYPGELRPEKQFNFKTSTMEWEHPNDDIPFIWLVNRIAVTGIKWYNSQKKP